MNLDCFSLNLFQLKKFVESKHQKKSPQRLEEEIRSLCRSLGQEATVHLLKVLLQFQEKSSHPVEPAVLSELASLLSSDSGRAAFVTAADQTAAKDLLPLITDGLGLSSAQSLALALSLTKANSPEVRAAGIEFIQKTLPQVLEDVCATDNLKELDHIVHGLLLYLWNNPSVAQEDTKKRFYQHLVNQFEFVPSVYRPLIPNFEKYRKEDQEFEHDDILKLIKSMDANQLPDLFREVGYGSTSTVGDCKKVLSKVWTMEGEKISPSAIAKTLFVMGKTVVGLLCEPAITSSFLERDFSANDIPKGWNPEVLAEAIHQRDPNFNWHDVVQSFDFPGFKVDNEPALILLVSCIKYGLHLRDKSAPYDKIPFPVDRVLQRWNNREGQFSFLKQALLSPNIIPFGIYECNQTQLSVLKSMPDTNDLKVKCWQSIDLMQALLNLGDDASLRERVKELIHDSIKYCPDVIVLALAQAQVHWSALRRDLLEFLLDKYIVNQHPNSLSIITFIWTNCEQVPQMRELLVHSLKKYYRESGSDAALIRVCDIAKEIKALQILLRVKSEDDFAFAIKLAIQASRHNYLNFKKWLEDYSSNVTFLRELNQYRLMVAAHPMSSLEQPKEVEIIREFLTQLSGGSSIGGKPPGVSQGMEPRMISPSVPFSEPSLASPSLLRGMSQLETSPPNIGGYTPADMNIGLPNLHRPIVSGVSPSSVPGLSFIQGLPQDASGLMTPASFGAIPGIPKPNTNNPIGFNFQPTQSVGGPSLTNPMQRPMPMPEEDVEVMDPLMRSVDNLYRELFSGKITEEYLVAQIQQMKTNPNQQKEFKMILSQLIKEFRHYSQFPTDKVECIAKVWGKILSDEILDDARDLKQFLDHVYHALKEGLKGNDKMLLFGETALQIFILKSSNAQEMLAKKAIYQQFCSRVVREIFANGGEKRITPPSMITRIKECAALADVRHPPNDVSDKIKFIINNMSPNNVKEKANEVRRLLDDNPGFYRWFGTYMIKERILKEENFLGLYAELTEALSKQTAIDPPFNQTVRSDLVTGIKALLQQDKQSGDMDSRKRLKYMGRFLGLITIERNRPIIADEIDFKLLLLEAHLRKRRGSPNSNVELKFVVPFVAKVIESTKKSEVFALRVETVQEHRQEPKMIATGNAWTRGVMCTLIELCMDPDAMEMVKFEVELLLKEQKLSMEHFEILSHESVLQSKEMMETIMSPRYKSQLSQNKDEGFQVPIATTPTDPRSLPTSMGSIHPPQPQRMNSQPSMEQPPMPSYTPQYYYDKVDVSTDDMSTLLPYIKVRENLPIVQALGGSQQVKLFLVAKAFSQCFLEQQPLCDLIERQIDRNSQIAAIATEALIKKDFALEIDDHLMSSCANYLSRYLAAGMSMNSLANKEIGFARNIQDRLQELIKQKLVSTPDEIINENAKILVEDNIELFICFIQKRTSHQAIRKVEARLLPEIRTRQRCRTDPGLERQFVQSLSNIRQYHLAVMPEQIRLTPQGVKQEQLRVYEEFAVNVPGFIPSAPTSINQRQAAQAAQAQAVQTQPQMNPAAPATQAWLSSNLVPLYKKHFETFKSKMAEIPRQDVGIPAADIRGMMQVLQTLTDGLQTAATTRDLESTTKFIKNLHYCFIVAFRKSHDPHAGSDEDRYWKSFASLFALCLREMQSSFDQEVSPNWFANRVLYSMDIQASTSQTTGIIDPFYLDPRYTEEMKLLLLNKIVLPDQYDKFLQHSIIQVAKCTLDQHATMFKLGALSPRQYLDRIIQFCIDLWVSLLANPAPTGPNKGDELVQEFAETIPIIVNNFNSHPFNSLSEETRSKVHEFKTRYLDAENTRFKIQMSNGNTAQQMMQSGMSEAKKDLRQAGAEFKNNTARQLLEQWVKIFSGRDAGRDSTRGFSAYVAILNEAHILKTDECIKRFIRCCTEICVDIPSNLDDMKMRLNVYQQIDAFVRLVCLLIKHSGDTTNPGTKVNLLNQVLGIVIGVCLEHQQQRGKDFDQMPFQRIFIMLFYELCAPEEVLVSINWHTLQAFTQAYHHLRPAKAPGFVFAWIELIGYRTYVSRMMSHTPEKKGWPMYAQLLSDMIKFMAPHLRNPSTMSPAFKQLYDGMLRLLLVLFHDYPQFLLSYHYAFCDIVPPNCIQLRNLILSAYPKHIADDPQYNTQKLILDNDVHEKLKLMGDMYRAPSILTKYENSIKPDEFKQKLELYLKDRQSTEFLTLDLVNYLMKTKEDQRTTGVKWNTLVINAVVIFVGEQAITQILGKQQAPNPDTVAHNSFMDIYQSLAVSLDTEGRYMFLNAIANQLRYPNVHTWYFMEVTLHLFAESGATVREQISRVMLERVLLQAPHPWGTLVTCLLMMKRQDFWEAEFVNSHPNIRKQLELFYEKALRQGVTYQKAPSLTET